MMSDRLFQLLGKIAGQCYFIDENDAAILLEHHWDTLPVLVRRSQGREVVLLKNLKTHLAKPMAQHDYLRDVSSWPEDIEAIIAERIPPHAQYLQ